MVFFGVGFCQGQAEALRLVQAGGDGHIDLPFFCHVYVHEE